MTGHESLTGRALRGTFWAYASNYSGKFLVFISTTILARLLLQEDFGLAGYALVVISFLEVLNDLGIGAAVIYHRDDPAVVNTAFWLNLAAGIALCALTWLVAEFAGSFFGDPRAVPLTRVLALSFPITALGNIHASLLVRRLGFKRMFVPDVTKAAGKGILSIALAWAGYGPWSLVIGQVGGEALAVIALWWAMPFRPSLRFSRETVRPLLQYGSNIVSANALATLVNQADYLIIGRLLGAAALGVYTLAFRVPELLVKQLVVIASRVLFPAFSAIREDPDALRAGFLSAMRYTSLVTVPIALGLSAVARPLVLTLFTAKWVEAIPVMSAIAIYTLIRSRTFNIGNVYKAQGRPDVLTKLALAKLPILLPALYWAAAVPASIVAVAWVQVAVTFLAGILNLVVAARLLDTPLRRLVAAFVPATVAGAIMAGAVLGALSLLPAASPVAQLAAAVPLGVAVYGAILWLLQRDLLRQATASVRLALGRA